MESIRTTLSHTPTTTSKHLPASGLPQLIPRPNPTDEPSMLLFKVDASTYVQAPTHSLTHSLNPSFSQITNMPQVQSHFKHFNSAQPPTSNILIPKLCNKAILRNIQKSIRTEWDAYLCKQSNSLLYLLGSTHTFSLGIHFREVVLFHFLVC